MRDDHIRGSQNVLGVLRKGFAVGVHDVESSGVWIDRHADPQYAAELGLFPIGAR